MKKKYKIWLYSSILTLIISFFGCSKGDTIEKNPVKVTDIEGNVYDTVIIGTQVWMKENLRTTRYNDSTVIPNVTDNAAWGTVTTGAYCWNENDRSLYRDSYGGLYNWSAVNTGKLCPTGWHVPSDTEWTTLITFLGGDNVAGGKLKEAGTANWSTPNTGATNESGFTAIPGGARGENGSFLGIGLIGFWWSATELVDYHSPWSFTMTYDLSLVWGNTYVEALGISVRCIRN